MSTSTKARLFAIGSEALSKISAQAQGRYGCPTCTRLLPVEALQTGALTLEHVPPEALGGKGIALTCKRCNNVAGHTVDAALHGRERFLDLGRALSGRGGSFEGAVTIDIDGVGTNAHLVLKDGNLTIEVPEKVNNPHHFDGQIHRLEERTSTKPDEPVDLRMNAKVKFNFRRALIGDLRAAFLAAFAQFGYRYAYHPRLDQVREQVAKLDELIIEGAWWIPGPEFTEDPMMVVQTVPFPAVLVRMKSALVALPWLVGPDDFYSEIREHLTVKPTQFSADVLEWPRTSVMVLDLYGGPATGEEA